MNDDRRDGRSSLEGGRITTDLDGLINDFSRLKVVVLGDALLDGYLEGATAGARGATARGAAELASAAAAVVVEKEGTVACSVRALRGVGMSEPAPRTGRYSEI